MTFSECGSDQPNPDIQVQADILRQTKSEFQALNQEICDGLYLPEGVVKFLTANAPEGHRAIALVKAQSMLQNNSDIFSVPDEVLPMILQSCLDEAELIGIVDEKEQGKTIIDVRNAEIKLRDIAVTDPAFKNLKSRDLLTALETHHLVTSSPHLQKYLGGIRSQMEAIGNVAATPEEAAALETILNAAPLYLGTDNMGAVFSDVLVAVDNSPDISVETKESIQKLFNIPTIKTAGDLQTVLDNGYGVDEIGNKLPISQEQKLRVFPNTYLYETPSGDRIFEIAVSGDRIYKVRFDQGTNEEALYNSTLTIQIMGLMAQMNLASAIWPRGWTLQEGGIIDLHYDDIITAKRVSNLMLGNMAGHDGRMFGTDSQYRMSHNFQAFPKKGDAAADDNNPDKALADYKELTILNQDSSLNWVQFERAALYLQGVTAKGGLPNFDDLKTHLRGGAELSVYIFLWVLSGVFMGI